MRAFPLHALRHLAFLIHEAETCPYRRKSLNQEIINRFNEFCVLCLESPHNWDKVMRKAEILGSLIYLLGCTMDKALVRKGHAAQTIDNFQESLMMATSPEKILGLLEQLCRELRVHRRLVA